MDKYMFQLSQEATAELFNTVLDALEAHTVPAEGTKDFESDEEDPGITTVQGMVLWNLVETRIDEINRILDKRRTQAERAMAGTGAKSSWDTVRTLVNSEALSNERGQLRRMLKLAGLVNSEDVK